MRKGAIEFETVVKWAIGLIILIILIVLLTGINTKSGMMLEKIKELLRFGK